MSPIKFSFQLIFHHRCQMLKADNGVSSETMTDPWKCTGIPTAVYPDRLRKYYFYARVATLFRLILVNTFPTTTHLSQTADLIPGWPGVPLMYLCIGRSRGTAGESPPPNGTQFFHFQIRFRQKAVCQRLAPPTENPGSATAMQHIITFNLGYA